MRFELEIAYRTDDYAPSWGCDRVIYEPNEDDLKRIRKLTNLCLSDESILTLTTECSGDVELQERTSEINEDETQETYEHSEDARYYDHRTLVVGTHGVCLRFHSKYSGDQFETEIFDL